FYLFTGVGAGIIHSIVTLIAGRFEPVIGASGALMGLLLATAAYYPNRRVYIWGILPITMMWLMILIAFVEIFALRSTSGNISHLTHIGGLISAYIYLTGYHRTTDITRWRYMG